MNSAPALTEQPLDPAFEARAINTIRMLAADGVQQAKSGHPGMPMGMAAAAFALWTRVMRYSPTNPDWPNRDRFVLSAGHGSMLLYALLHLTGFDLPLDELRNFRQWDSMTAGHPEYGHAPGIETTTGPLGQGFANGVGMAIAAKWLAARFNKPGYALMDHYVYAIAGDGCLMEGISSEAASLAGHLKLDNLIISTTTTTSPSRAARIWPIRRIGPSASRPMAGMCSASTGWTRKRWCRRLRRRRPTRGPASSAVAA